MLYTDGACEADFSGVGAVLFMGGLKAWVIEESVPSRLLGLWRCQGTKHAIAQVELLPVWVALKTWAVDLMDTDLLIFTDNACVKDGLVRGCSRNLASRFILFRTSELELRLGVIVWISRVPSHSNPADAQSRMRVEELNSWCEPCRGTPMHAHNASREMDKKGASLSAWHLRDGNGG